MVGELGGMGWDGMEWEGKGRWRDWKGEGGIVCVCALAE